MRFLPHLTVLLASLFSMTLSDVNVIVVVMGNDPFVGYHAIMPMYDVALSNLQRSYPRTFDKLNKIVVWNSNTSASDMSGAAVVTAFGEVYNTAKSLNAFTVIVSPGSIREISILGDLARELNLPLLASSSAFVPDEAPRYPTTISFSPSGQESLRTSLTEFLVIYHWTRVTIICDKLSQNMNFAKLVSVACTNLIGDLQKFPDIHMHQVVVDSGVNVNFDDALRSAKNHGPVIVLLTAGFTVRTFMVSAYHLNMTSGSSVFLYALANTVPGVVPVNWNVGEPDDEVAFEAFKSLLLLSFVSPPWSVLTPYTTAAQRIAESVYDQRNMAVKTKNTYAIAALEMICAFGQVMDEAEQTSGPVGTLDTETLVNHFRNRTFGLEIGTNVSVGENGIRVVDTTFHRMDNAARVFKPTWFFAYANKTMLTLDEELAANWPGGLGPPEDRSAEMNEEIRAKNANSTVIGAVVGGIGGLLLAVALAYFARRISTNRSRYSTWWRLEPWRVQQNYAVTNGKANSREVNSTIKTSYGIQLAKYDEDIVWKQMSKFDVSMDTISSNKIARRTLAEIRATHHENIGKLYGIAVHDGKMELLWQHDRGSLRTILDDEKFPLDIGLKTSLIFETLTGLQVIHNSSLRFHGMLSSLNTMIDMHYSIKLCAAGSSRIFSALTQDRSASGGVSTDLWLAPEMLSDTSFAGSREADVYAVAILISEIITSGSSIVFDLKNSSSLIRTLSSLTSAVQSSSSAEFAEVPGEIRTLLTQSFSFDIKDRPKVSGLIAVMNKYFPRQSVMDRMLERFQQYSQDLEITVRARTHELEAEGLKVNALLEEMIPPSLVGRLRNKEIIPAEGFECVTIFFSSLIDFGDFCSKSTPLLIVELLNRVYSTFDTILQDFDVYKVETIKDGYMVASGVPLRNDNRHAYEICSMAMEFLRMSFVGPFLHTHLGRLQIRIGIHSGAVAAGVVGLLMPRYCLFGDTVNVASRMESFGQASRIHISSTTHELIKSNPKFETSSRGMIPIKGKGDMETFWVAGKTSLA